MAKYEVIDHPTAYVQKRLTLRELNPFVNDYLDLSVLNEKVTEAAGKVIWISINKYWNVGPKSSITVPTSLPASSIPPAGEEGPIQGELVELGAFKTGQELQQAIQEVKAQLLIGVENANPEYMRKWGQLLVENT